MEIKRIYRWVILLPITVLATLTLHQVLQYLYDFDFFPREHKPTRLAWYYIVFSVVVGYAFVSIGTLMAPDYKRRVAQVLTIMFLIAGIAYVPYLWMHLEDGLIREIMATISAMLGCLVAYIRYCVPSKDYARKYQELCRSETPLSDEQWDELTRMIDEDYPTFRQKLEEMETMSGLERQVCYLIKAGATPTQMTVILCKSKQGISSIRARLYQKNFGNGGAEDWDKLIKSV